MNDISKKIKICKEHFLALTDFDRGLVDVSIDVDFRSGVVDNIFFTIKIDGYSDSTINSITRNMKMYEFKIDNYFKKYRINQDLKPYKGDFNHLPPSMVYNIDYDGNSENLKFEIQYHLYYGE